jgi:ATP-dependent Clp protease protease subunit
MGAFLLAGGTKGKRYCLANGEVMIHQILGGVGGQATDIMIESNHMKSLKGRMNAILARNTGHTPEEIEEATDRNNWMYAEDAQAFGIIDTVLEEGAKL